jgi:hypothetical protein
MRILSLMVAVAMMVVVGGGMVAAQEETPQSIGFVRFAHLSIDQAPVDVYYNDEVLVADLAYGEYTAFYVLPAADGTFDVRVAGSDPDTEPIASLGSGVQSNLSQLIAVVGLNANISLAVEPLNIVRNATNSLARVRVFNAVAGAAALSITNEAGTDFGTGTTFLSVIDADVEPSTYTFTVTDANGASVLSQEVELEPDMVYLLVLHGGAEGNPPVELLVIPSEQETTRVRFINESGTAGDIYLEGTDEPLQTNFDGETDFIDVPSGAATFVLRGAGAAADSTALASTAVQLFPAREVTIRVSGTGDDTVMEVVSDEIPADLVMSTMGESSDMDGGMESTMEATMDGGMESTMEATMQPDATMEATP